MPETVRCPNCNKEVTVADDAKGQRVACSACGMRFDPAFARPSISGAPANDDAPRRPEPRQPDRRELDDDYSRPSRERPPLRSDDGVISVDPDTCAILARGALLQMLAQIALLVSLFILALLLLQSLDGPGSSRSDSLRQFVGLGLVFFLVTSWLLNTIAGAFWAMAPTRGVSRPIGVAIFAFSLLITLRTSDLTTLVVNPTRDRPDFEERMDRELVPLRLIGAYNLDVLRMILLAAYLAAVARDTGRNAARTNAILLAVMTPLFLLGPVALTILANLADMRETPRILAFGLLTLGSLVSLLWSLVTVMGLRSSWARMAARHRV